MLQDAHVVSSSEEASIPLTENGKAVLKRRYLRRGDDGKPAESIVGMFRRVASHIAAPEAEHGGDVAGAEEKFYDLLTQLRFMPNSPTFTGAGTPLGQLAACFVLPIADDMGRDPAGIFQTLRNAALIQQTGGGNGFAFSRLRPRKARVKSSAGEATGPVGFLRVYDQAFGEIAQGGTRRGANMAVLRVDHPDILDFISCKTSEDAITNFNISVGITDKFMRAVEADSEFELINPQDGKVWDTVQARALFDEIVKHAHANGEPGLLFLDAANRTNPVPHLYELEATNPCFIGDTRIATDKGWVKIVDLAEKGQPFYTATDDRAPMGGVGLAKEDTGVALRAALPAALTRRQTDVMRLETKHGYQLTATPDHELLTANRGYVALQDLRRGDQLLLQSAEGSWSQNWQLPNVAQVQMAMATLGRGGDRASGQLTTRQDFQAQYANMPTVWSHKLGMVLGYLVGDGWLSPTSNAPLDMAFDSRQTDVIEEVHSAMREWFGAGHLHDRGTVQQLTYGRMPAEFFATLGLKPVRATEKQVPESVWSAPREVVVGFLQGLFTADGSVQVNEAKQDCTVRLASSSRELVSEVQSLLLNFGIVSRVYRRRPTMRRLMPDGKGGQKEYDTAEQFELVIGKANRNRFAELIGFVSEAKQLKLRGFIDGQVRGPYRERFVAKVVGVFPAGIADVYDFTEPVTHSLIANGFVAHNCGEQWLGPYENCCLGSINLARHITDEREVDWDLLQQSIEEATHFLDNVVTANAYVPAVPELVVAAHNARRIGLGIMGLGDLMYQLGVRYGSHEGQMLAGVMMEFVRYHCMKTSIGLAKERGSFTAIMGSIYDPDDLKWEPPTSLIAQENTWGRPEIDWQSVVTGIKQHGIRNAAQTTVAPTGTIATVSGCEGYGCEPVFALAYIRHVNDNGKDLQLYYTSPLFEKALKEAGLDEAKRQEIVEEVVNVGTCQHVLAVPEAIRNAFAVASDITPEEHIRMQGAIQAFVDNSISKTCNFPAGATRSDVAQAYKMAWELGCKGLTVYVTGSRDKVVLETKATKEAKEKKEKKVEQPVLWREGKKPRSKALKGETHKINTPLGTTYITINANGDAHPFEVFMHTSKAGSDTMAVSEAIGRLISYILRLASPVSPRDRLHEVVEQLGGIGGGRPLGFGSNRVLSLPDGVAQVLNDYLSQEVEVIETNGHHPNQLNQARLIGDLCPECGEAAVVNEEGCRKCYSCAYSEC